MVGLSESIDERIRFAFDTTRISREMVGKGMDPTSIDHLASDVIHRTVIDRKLALQVKGQD